MKKNLFLLILCLLPALLAFAEKAEQAHVFNRANGGFVIVDENNDIVAFSDKGTITDLPESAQVFLQSAGLTPHMTNQHAPATIEALLHAATTDSVGPLLGDIAYDQDGPYNGKTPIIAGYHSPTGCVATAMTQIMAYYQHPKECHGAVSYKTSTLNIPINENLEGYKPDWDNILPAYPYGQYSKTQADAIADLMYAAGVAIHMDYNRASSGAISDDVGTVMATHFDYDIAIEFVAKADYTDADWHNILQGELKAGRVMYYSSQQREGAGHAYVCDGYKVQEGYEKYPFYHFNWGWSGVADGWYRLNKLTAKIEIGGEELEISQNQRAYINIRPKDNTPIELVEVTTSDAPIYDLFGRQVSELIPGQIYIQSNRKFIAQ